VPRAAGPGENVLVRDDRRNLDRGSVGGPMANTPSYVMIVEDSDSSQRQ